MSELGEHKNKLEFDLEASKDQADFRIAEYKESFEKEKDKWKGKVHEGDVKNREGEARRTALIFEHEKERTRWNLEKEHLINQKNDVLESLDKLEKKKETYLRENERLRNENKKNRRLLGNAPNGLASLMDGCRYGSYMNTSKYAERSFRKEEIRLPTQSDKGDKENDFLSNKFSILEGFENSESKHSKSPIGELVRTPKKTTILGEMDTNVEAVGLDEQLEIITEQE